LDDQIELHELEVTEVVPAEVQSALTEFDDIFAEP